MEAVSTVRTKDQVVTPQAWGVLVVVCGAIFLEGVDIAMLNVAVPAIAADIGLATGAAHWVISAYVLGYAGFMLLGGRTADLLGRRRVFLLSLAVFVAFSGLGGITSDVWLLILARFVTGVAAAFMTPSGFSIVTSSFPEGPLRNRALSVYGAIGAGGFVLGTMVGGLLTTASWRWVFLAPMIFGSMILIGGLVMIKRDRPPAVGRAGFDVGGAVTVTGGMIAMIYALVSFGENRDVVAGLLAVLLSVVLVGAFVIIERRVPAPLIRLRLLREGALPWVTIAGLLYIAAFFSFQFAITLFLQDWRNWTPLITGLTFAVMGADVVLAPLVTPRLVARFGNLRVMTAGLLVGVAAFGSALRLQPDWNYLDLLPSLIMVAIAFALVYGPLAGAATAGLDESEHGVAGGVVYTGFQFGAAIGLAVVTIVLVGGHTDVAGPDDYQRSMIVPAGLAVLAAVTGLVAIRVTRRVGS